jgi:hypothetical protein
MIIVAGDEQEGVLIAAGVQSRAGDLAAIVDGLGELQN